VRTETYIIDTEVHVGSKVLPHHTPRVGIRRSKDIYYETLWKISAADGRQADTGVSQQETKFQKYPSFCMVEGRGFPNTIYS